MIVNAQDVNLYTYIEKKERKKGKSMHVEQIVPMKNKPHAYDMRERTHMHAHCTYT